ncbi:MAG: hypothetical protein ABI557_14275 [Aureliella sp.]
MHALESSLLQSVDQQLSTIGLPTQFGPSKIDLTGLTSRKAMLMFQATAGRERTAWGEVAYFLAQREAENLTTLRLVRQSVQCAEDEQWEQALQWLERALQSWPTSCDNRLLLEYREELHH